MQVINPYFDELSDVQIQDELKTCRRCNESKHYTDFAHRSYNKNGDKEYKNYLEIGTWCGRGTTRCFLDGIIPRDDINPQTLTTSVETDVFSPIQGPPAYDASGLAGYQDAIMKEVMPTAFTGVPPTDPQPTAFTGVAPTGPQPTMFTGATPSDPQFFSRFTGTTTFSSSPISLYISKYPAHTGF